MAEQGPADDADLTARLQAYFAEAGITGQPVVRRAAEGLFVAQLPPMSICVMYSGRSQWVADGDTLFDARAQDDDLALIYGVTDAQGVSRPLCCCGETPTGCGSPCGRRRARATDRHQRPDRLRGRGDGRPASQRHLPGPL